MKRSLILGAYLAVGAALAGCGGPPPVSQGSGGGGGKVNTVTATEPPSEPGKYGGKLTMATTDDPKTFNLWGSAEVSSSDILGPLYEPLNNRNSYTLKFEPALADLPKISADGLTYTYQLKPGLQWSDGQPLNTDDILFTLDMLFDPKTETIMREGMMIETKQPDGTVKKEPFKYKKVDDRTVEFTLPHKFAPAESIFGFPIAPKHKLEAAYKAGKINSTWSVDTPPSELVASGPFVISEYVPRQRILYAPNKHYWRKTSDGKPLPYLDQWIVLIVPDVNTAMLKFRNGDTDIAGVQQTDYPTFKRDESKGDYKVIDRGPGWGFGFLGFNQNPESKIDKNLVTLFSDVRFRQAMSHCINRKRICEDIFLGLAEPLWGPVTPADKVFFDPNVPKFEYDIDKAKKLLTDIGLKDSDGNGLLEYNGKEVKFNILVFGKSEQSKKEATIITDDLKKVGINGEATPIDFNDLVRRLDTPPYDWEACILGFTGGPEPYDGSNIWKSSGPSHQWRPKQKTPATPWEAEIDKLWAEGAEELDPAKRKAIYDRWQTVVAEQQPFNFTVVTHQLTAVRNRIGNFKPPSTRDSLWNIYEVYDRTATKSAP
jgi:peptide/nickel transport system substrate-binding protein